MKRTIENCKVIYYYGKPEQHDGKCDGVMLYGDLIETCKRCYLHNSDNARKFCAECGKEFYSTNGNVKFCSKECKAKHRTKAGHQPKTPERKTLDEVIADMNEYNRTHGTHLTYGKYQDMIFREALKNEKNRK